MFFSNAIQNAQINDTQKQIDEVVEIMTHTVSKVLERGEKVAELDERVNLLNDSSTHFVQQAARLRRQQWWENRKWTIILCAVSILTIGIILFSLLH